MSRHSTRERRLRLAADPSAVPWARRVLRQTLQEWQLSDLSDTAQLLVSELVTNAVKATGTGGAPGPEPGWRDLIGLTLELTDACLLLEVWDADPRPPVLRDAGLAAEGGRGLLIVEALSSKWGQEPAAGGKTVWCELELPEAVAAALP